MKKMRKALLALLLSITVAGTSAVPVMAAGTNTSVPTVPAQEADSSKADKLFTAVKGDYVQLFKDVLFDVRYDKYWNDDAAAVVGAGAAKEAVKTLKASVGSSTYGDKADPNAFYCGFINDVKEVSFQDGGKVEFTTTDSKKVSHTYKFLKKDALSGVMEGYVFQSTDKNEDEFKYVFLCPDTPATTYHIEFRYDVDAAHVVRAAVARRADAFDVDERIDMFGFGKVDDAVEPGVKTALGIGIRRDQHVVVRQETQCGRANHRRAAFVADQPCVAANRTQRHAYFQRTQRAVRFRSGLRGLRNVEAGDHQRAGRPTFLAVRQVACGSEQIAARIRHQRFGTASDVGSRHACDTRDFRIIPPIQHAHVAFLPWSGFCFCDCDALRVRGVRFTRRPAAVSAGRRVN